MEIPRNCQFTGSSTLLGIKLDAISIETGHEREMIGDGFLVDIRDSGSIRSFGSSSDVEI
jgi:hypothetical protein